jgi:dUTP pyrophosphatase
MEQHPMENRLLWTGPHQYAPTQGKPGDAGLDLRAVGSHVIPVAMTKWIPVGINVKTPMGTWALITGRSSMNRRGLIAINSVIDEGYTGPLLVGIMNMSGTAGFIDDGDRIGQLILMYNVANSTPIAHVDVLPETDRGTDGWGSTGR